MKNPIKYLLFMEMSKFVIKPYRKKSVSSASMASVPLIFCLKKEPESVAIRIFLWLYQCQSNRLAKSHSVLQLSVLGSWTLRGFLVLFSFSFTVWGIRRSRMNWCLYCLYAIFFIVTLVIQDKCLTD